MTEDKDTLTYLIELVAKVARGELRLEKIDERFHVETVTMLGSPHPVFVPKPDRTITLTLYSP